MAKTRSAKSLLIGLVSGIVTSGILLLYISWYVPANLALQPSDMYKIWGASALIFGIYLWRAHLQMVSRKAKQAPSTIKAHHLLIAQRQLQKISFLLRNDARDPNSYEKEVLWVAHQTSAFLWIRWISVSLLATTALGTALWFGLPFKYVVLIGVVSSLLAWLVWVDWSSYYQLITDNRITLARVNPSILFILPEEYITMPLREGGNAQLKRSTWGKLFKYGTLVADSPSDDGRLNNMRGTPRPEDAERILRSAIEAAKIRIQR